MEKRKQKRKYSEKVLGAIAKDRNDGKFCDLEILCENTRFPVHRNVVCLHSSVIYTACLGPWKEAASGVFEIKESSPVLVGRMLDYIYTGDYADFSANDCRSVQEFRVQEFREKADSDAKVELDVVAGDHVTLHAQMMELGDMYLVDGLSRLASDKFTLHLASTRMDTIIRDIIPRFYAMKFDSSNAIRKSVAAQMRTKLAKRPWAAGVEEYLENVTRDVPEFTRDLLKSYMEVACEENCWETWGSIAAKERPQVG
ncbi:hypothetical protein E4U13_008211 [Claviceps humidiphila]|uniref:BTB domain-containing protein n=1 Tax=Claviceps humidiphila TaxID=1294629 RepID=A0A9P7TWA1_9HYPO|nr:hypothetical protein E4U13_008211 [Claviceps humidiphila]